MGSTALTCFVLLRGTVVKDMGACVVITYWNGASRERPEGQRERETLLVEKGNGMMTWRVIVARRILEDLRWTARSTVEGVACGSNLDISVCFFSYSGH